MAATIRSTALYARRRRVNGFITALSIVAALCGLSWLVWILAVLLWNGFGGLSLAVFTQMTPPPGRAGGLLNPIVGSLILTALAVLFGTPLGILATSSRRILDTRHPQATPRPGHASKSLPTPPYTEIHRPRSANLLAARWLVLQLMYPGRHDSALSVIRKPARNPPRGNRPMRPSVCLAFRRRSAA